jgi:hypothetical protein
MNLDSNNKNLKKLNKNYNKKYDIDFIGEIKYKNKKYATYEDIKQQINNRKLEILKQEAEIKKYKANWDLNEPLRLKKCCVHKFDYEDICTCINPLLYETNFKKGSILFCDYCKNEFCGCMDY